MVIYGRLFVVFGKFGLCVFWDVEVARLSFIGCLSLGVNLLVWQYEVDWKGSVEILDNLRVEKTVFAKLLERGGCERLTLQC